MLGHMTIVLSLVDLLCLLYNSNITNTECHRPSSAGVRAQIHFPQSVFQSCPCMNSNTKEIKPQVEYTCMNNRVLLPAPEHALVFSLFIAIP